MRILDWLEERRNNKRDGSRIYSADIHLVFHYGLRGSTTAADPERLRALIMAAEDENPWCDDVEGVKPCTTFLSEGSWDHCTTTGTRLIFRFSPGFTDYRLRHGQLCAFRKHLRDLVVLIALYEEGSEYVSCALTLNDFVYIDA